MLILIIVYYAKFMINKEQHVFALKFAIGNTCGWHKLNFPLYNHSLVLLAPNCMQNHAVTYAYHT